MELVATIPTRSEQSGLFKECKVLGDRLPGRREPVLRSEARADLEQRLLVPSDQFIQDHSSRVVSDGLVDIAHTPEDRQVLTCMSISPLATGNELLATSPQPSGSGGSSDRGDDSANAQRKGGTDGRLRPDLLLGVDRSHRLRHLCYHGVRTWEDLHTRGACQNPGGRTSQPLG